MKKYFVLLVVTFLYCSAESATISPLTNISSAYTNPVNPMQQFSTLSVKEVQKLAGRKLKLKERIAFKIFQWKLKKDLKSPKKEGETDKGKTALTLGICAAVALFIPFVNLASIPLAILAIVIGSKAKKEDPKNKKARTGVTLGIATLAFIIVIGLIVALVLTLGTIGP